MMICTLLRLLVLWLGVQTMALAQTPVTAIVEAEVAVRITGATTFTAFERVILPHRWERLFPGQGGSAIYRVVLPEMPAGPEANAVYATRIANRFDVFAGGVRIARFGEPGENASYGGQPVVIPVPASALAGERILEIRVEVDPVPGGGLAQLYFAREGVIRSLQRGEAWARTTVPMMTLAALLVLIAFSLVLWLRTGDALYGLFTGLAGGWVLRISAVFITHPPLPPVWWAALLATAYPVYTGFLFLFTARLFGFDWKSHRNVIVPAMILAAMTAFASTPLGLPVLYTTVLGGLALAALFFWSRALWATLTAPSWEKIVFSLTATINIVCAVRDWLMIRLDPNGLGVVDWSRVSVALFNLVIGWIIADRFIQSLRAYRELSGDLERRVLEREGELARVYEERRKGESENAVQLERQRIMRDMHDGLGAQLVGLLGSLKSGTADPRELERQVRDSLDQLRLTIDALEPVEGDLATVLGHLRFRLGRRFESAGIRLDWRVEALPELPYLTPTIVSHIQKIAVEAFTNIVKHAHAREVRVGAHADATHVHIEIEDNGTGLPDSLPRNGRGLENMRFRARAIGAQLTLGRAQHAGSGTCLSLTLPRQTVAA